MITFEKLQQELKSKTILEIKKSPFSDEGITLIFTDNSVLDVGFSSCEGSISFNSDLVEEHFFDKFKNIPK